MSGPGLERVRSGGVTFQITRSCYVHGNMALTRMPPTSLFAEDEHALPYFLWWTDVTVGQFRKLIHHPEVETRAYWIGSLLREANTRDVWSFVAPAEVRDLWPALVRHLGRKREMCWASREPSPGVYRTCAPATTRTRCTRSRPSAAGAPQPRSSARSPRSTTRAERPARVYASLKSSR
jgi:hypothetical protein